MKDIILQKLKDIEKKEDVTILYAVESGSRAWGFESQDSDYDVRFIYVRKEKDYLSLFPKKDVIEYELNSIFDINGWDIQKVLKLAQKSNPTLYEWIHSPIIYYALPLWNDLLPFFDSTVQLSKLIKHYYYMTFNHYDSQFLTTKKYFYILRTMLCCLWIIQSQTLPPVPFMQLVEAQLDPTYHELIHKMMNTKKSKEETYISEDFNNMNTYIEEQLHFIKQHLDDQYDFNEVNQKDLNSMFLHFLKETS